MTPWRAQFDAQSSSKGPPGRQSLTQQPDEGKGHAMQKPRKPLRDGR